MEILSEDALIKRIAASLKRRQPEILFLAFDSARDLQIILREGASAPRLRLSDYCREDSTPNFDQLQEDLEKNDKCRLVLGIGEYRALTGDNKPLNMLWSMRKAGKSFIVPLWRGYRALEDLRQGAAFLGMDDPILFLKPSRSPWTYKKYTLNNPVQCNGFRALLRLVEEGYTGEATVMTRVRLSPNCGKLVQTYAELYHDRNPESRVSLNALNEAQWKEQLENTAYNDRYFFGAGNFLNLLNNGTDNLYLRRVLDKTDNQTQFRTNFIEVLLDYKLDDPEFKQLLKARQELSDQIGQDERREFILKLAVKPPRERIAYLSGSTEEEKQELLKCISEDLSLASLCDYDDLHAYMGDYKLNARDEELASILDYYIKIYKQAKLGNQVSEELLKIGEENYIKIFRLPQQKAIVDTFAREGTKLYWLDAFGCEYLGFINHFIQKEHLDMQVTLARTILPSITHLNRQFYDEWPAGLEKVASKELDNIKHGRDMSSSYNPDEGKNCPIHLIYELEVIKKLLRQIAGELRSGKYDRVVLASDHGATRLAVISEKEQILEMPEKGKYGGRCCPIELKPEGKPAHTVYSDDEKWLVVSDYSRFKGSHKASVEVHGGATIEEAVVPVIEFTLEKRPPVIIQLKPEKTVKIKPDQKTLEVEIKSDIPLIYPALEIGEKRYSLIKTLQNTYKADIVAKGLKDDVEGTVFSNNKKLSTPIKFKIMSGMRKNDNFEL